MAVLAALDPKTWWYTARAAGLVAWVLVALSVLWGLTLSTRTFGRNAPPAWLLDLHRHLGGLAVVFTSLVQRRIPRRWWRGVHFAKFPRYALATIHLVTAGTDHGVTAVHWTAVVVTVLVVFLSLVRWSQTVDKRARAAREPRVPRARPDAAAADSWTRPDIVAPWRRTRRVTRRPQRWSTGSPDTSRVPRRFGSVTPRGRRVATPRRP